MSTSNQLSKLLSNVPEDVFVTLNQIHSNGFGRKSNKGGQVSTVIDRFTRDNRPFKVVTLEMVDGSLEAVVWEDVLEKTKELWNPGRLLNITGTVRERDGETTISVQSAKELNLEKLLDTGSMRDHQDGKASQLPQSANGSILHQPDEIERNDSVTDPSNLKAEKGNLDETSPRKKLVLCIKESSDLSKDQMLLDDVKRMLLGSVGNDDVGLEIETDSTVIVMDWQPVKVHVNDE